MAIRKAHDQLRRAVRERGAGAPQ
eukprot:IDg7380t1